MTNFQRCILRVGSATWMQDEQGACRDLGRMTNDEAVALSIRERLHIRVVRPQTQGAFARDVAAERFGLNRANMGLWFVATAAVAVWARY